MADLIALFNGHVVMSSHANGKESKVGIFVMHYQNAFKSRNTSERIAKPRELAPTIFLTCLQLIAEISGVV